MLLPSFSLPQPTQFFWGQPWFSVNQFFFVVGTPLAQCPRKKLQFFPAIGSFQFGVSLLPGDIKEKSRNICILTCQKHYVYANTNITQINIYHRNHMCVYTVCNPILDSSHSPQRPSVFRNLRFYWRRHMHQLLTIEKNMHPIKIIV